MLPHTLKPEDHYRLHKSPEDRIQHGVDHENYAYQLALDMETAPSALYMMSRGTKLFVTWALGSNFNTKFRLVGPWAFPDAERIMKTELWTTIRRRGGFFGKTLSFCFHTYHANSIIQGWWYCPLFLFRYLGLLIP